MIQKQPIMNDKKITFTLHKEFGNGQRRGDSIGTIPADYPIFMINWQVTPTPDDEEVLPPVKSIVARVLCDLGQVSFLYDWNDFGQFHDAATRLPYGFWFTLKHCITGFPQGDWKKEKRYCHRKIVFPLALYGMDIEWCRQMHWIATQFPDITMYLFDIGPWHYCAYQSIFITDAGQPHPDIPISLVHQTTLKRWDKLIPMLKEEGIWAIATPGADGDFIGFLPLVAGIENKLVAAFTQQCEKAGKQFTYIDDTSATKQRRG